MLIIAWKMDPKLTVFYYGSAAVASLGPAAAGITMIYLIDNLQISQGASQISIPLILIAILATRYAIIFIQGVFRDIFYQTYCDYLFRYKIQNYLTYMFYSKMAGLDISHLEDTETQNLIAKARDTVAWRVPDFFRGGSYVFEGLIGFIAAFAVLLPISWWIPFVITLVVMPRLYLRLRYGEIEWSIYGSGVPEARKLSYFQGLFADRATITEIRIFQAQKALLEKFKNIQDYLLALYRKPLNHYVLSNLAPMVLEIVVLIIIASVKLPDVLSGVLTIGSFALIISMIDQLNNQAGQLSSTLGWVYRENLYVDYFLDVLKLPKKIEEKENPVIFSQIEAPSIEFKNVTFGYKKDNPILKNVSFRIEPGESLALVGENGAGKTTIIKLLCRFYDVDEGEILINGVNIKDLSLSNWYQFLGTLFQDFVKYQFTVKDNIILGNSDKFDKDLMIEAAKKAGIADKIESFPKKYDQFLGRNFEDGEELSIGQWQKIAIARAFYEAAPVLILDEPTSAIDPESEYEIFNQLEKSYKDKTLILVSHRFSTVRNANKILVVEDGKIAETGTHQELMKKNGRYARMFTVQAKSYNSKG